MSEPTRERSNAISQLLEKPSLSSDAVSEKIEKPLVPTVPLTPLIIPKLPTSEEKGTGESLSPLRVKQHPHSTRDYFESLFSPRKAVIRAKSLAEMNKLSSPLNLSGEKKEVSRHQASNPPDVSQKITSPILLKIPLNDPNAFEEKVSSEISSSPARIREEKHHAAKNNLDVFLSPRKEKSRLKEKHRKEKHRSKEGDVVKEKHKKEKHQFKNRHSLEEKYSLKNEYLLTISSRSKSLIDVSELSPSSSSLEKKESPHDQALNFLDVRLSQSREKQEISQDQASTPFDVTEMSKISPFSLSQVKKQASSLNLLDIAESKDPLYYLKLMPKLMLYNLNVAEKEIKGCFSSGSKKPHEVVSSLLEIENEPSFKHSERLNHLLTQIFLWKEARGAEIISLYFQQTKKGIIASFAEKGMSLLEQDKRFITKKEKASYIFFLLDTYTKLDLNIQQVNTFAREDRLSSALCKIYGESLAKQELEQIHKFILTELKNSKLSSLCLNRDQLKKILNLEDENEIQIQIKENCANFQPFAEKILEQIYSMTFNEEFSKLLKMHRLAIMVFLDANKEKDSIQASGIYSGALFLLRILYPHIVNITRSEPSSSILISLTKVLQCLAKEGSFGDEKPDPIYINLQPLVNKFREKHKKFIDELSLPFKMSLPQHKPPDKNDV